MSKSGIMLSPYQHTILDTPKRRTATNGSALQRKSNPQENVNFRYAVKGTETWLRKVLPFIQKCEGAEIICPAT